MVQRESNWGPLDFIPTLSLITRRMDLGGERVVEATVQPHGGVVLPLPAPSLPLQDGRHGGLCHVSHAHLVRGELDTSLRWRP